MGGYSKIKIAYYSGTGGTALAAKIFREKLEQRGCSCSVDRITDKLPSPRDEHDLLLLCFPVHAFNAPQAVYKWIEKLNPVQGAAAAIISVSGGGEIFPNTACRLSSIKRLAKKGYHVFYETMLVMPSNIFVATEQALSLMLLQVLPDKVSLAADDILSGRDKRTAPLLADRLLSIMGELEKPGARLWGRGVKPLATCDGCGWCAENCPSGNIAMRDGKPRFSAKCHLCLQCIYGCHKKALSPMICKFFILKQGYDLHALLEKSPLNEAADIKQLAAGRLWSGVKKYLLE